MAARHSSAVVASLFIVGLFVPAAAQDSHTVYSADEIEAGAQLYGRNCVTCHGVSGDAVGAAKLSSGQFRRAANERDLLLLIQNGIPNAGMPAQKLSAHEIGTVVAYLYNMRTYKQAPPTPGDAERGKLLFAGKAACTDCHRVGATGAVTAAPDLADIGRQRNETYFKTVLLDPSTALLPINRPVAIAMKDGRTVRGRRLNEDTYTVQIVDSEGRLRSIEKAATRAYTVETKSAMPSFKDKLTAQELNDVVAYLASLKG